MRSLLALACLLALVGGVFGKANNGAFLQVRRAQLTARASLMAANALSAKNPTADEYQALYHSLACNEGGKGDLNGDYKVDSLDTTCPTVPTAAKTTLAQSLKAHTADEAKKLASDFAKAEKNEIPSSFIELGNAPGLKESKYRWPVVADLPVCYDTGVSEAFRVVATEGLAFMTANTGFTFAVVECTAPGHKLKLIEASGRPFAQFGCYAVWGTGCTGDMLAKKTGTVTAASTTQPLQYDPASYANARYGFVHELFHTMGLAHTQQRFDRDSYVVVPQCIKDLDAGNYDKLDTRSWEDYGKYSYDSIMHYPPWTAGGADCNLTEGPDSGKAIGSFANAGLKFYEVSDFWDPNDTATLRILYPALPTASTPTVKTFVESIST